MSLVFKDFTFDRERRQLLRGGQPVRLEPKAYELLGLLLERRPTALSKAQIRDVIWPAAYVSETALSGLVTDLRNVLGDDVRQSRFIRTVHGFGYAFCGEAIETGDGRALVPPSGERAPDPPRPYPGLASFTEADAASFFGREAEVEALLERIRRQKLVMVVGPSGVGKTSFVRAGVLASRPAGWGGLVMTPGCRPFATLAQGLSRELSGDTEALDELINTLADPAPDTELLKTVSRWRTKHAEALVVVDQFEELFTQNPAEVQGRFARLLGALAEEADVRVLLSMRDDLLLRCSEHEALLPLFEGMVPLRPPSESALRRAVSEPASREGYAFEDRGLVEEMVQAVATERGALPLLAFAISQLWEKRDRERRLLTREAYLEIAGVEGALAQHAEATLEAAGPGQERIVREIFRNLTTAQGTRASLDREEVLSAFSDREGAERVLRRLVDARLLTSYEGEEGVGGASRQRVEIVHESLLKAWPRLVRWQTQDADGAQLRDQIRQAARLWNERDRPDDLLWSGTAHRDFALWRERYAGGLTVTEEAFAGAMTRLAERRRSRRRLVIASLCGVCLTIAAATSWLWRRAEVQKGYARAAELVARGAVRLEDYPTEALAYALASLERADTAEGRRSALKALAYGGAAYVLPTASQAVAFSRDGRWLAKGGLMSGALLWRREGGAPVSFGRWVGVPRVDFDPDGDLLSIQDDATLRIFAPPGTEAALDLETGPSTWALLRRSRLFTFTKHKAGRSVHSRTIGKREDRFLGLWDDTDAPDADVSPDGEWLAYVRDRTVYLRSLENLEASPRAVGTHSSRASWVSFETNSVRLVSASERGEIRIWPDGKEARGGAGVRTIQAPVPTAPVATTHLDMDSAGSTLVAGRYLGDATSQVAFVWDLNGPPDAEPRALRNANVRTLIALALDPTGRWLATANNDVAVLWPLGARSPRVLRGQVSSNGKVRFTPDGRYLVSSSTLDGSVLLWPLSPGVAPRRRILIQEPEERGFPNLAIDPTGRNLIAATIWTDRVLLVPLDGGAPRTLPRYSEAWMNTIAFSRDGQYAAAGTRMRAEGNLIELWDVRSGTVRTLDPRSHDKECGREPKLQSAVHGVEFTSDGHLLTAGLSGLRLWDLDEGTNTLLRPCTDGYFPTLAAATMEDRFLLTEIDSRLNRSILTFYDFRAGVSRVLTSHGNGVRCAALDAKGEVVVTGGFDGVVRVGPVSDDKEAHLLFGHGREISSVAVSPDGRWLASGSQDGTIRLWPMPEGRPFHTLPYTELLERLRAATNLRVVEDSALATGYKIEVGPFPGWENMPTW